MFRALNDKLRYYEGFLEKEKLLEDRFVDTENQLKSSYYQRNWLNRKRDSIRRKITVTEATGVLGNILNIFLDKKSKLATLGASLTETEGELAIQSQLIEGLEKEYTTIKKELKHLDAYRLAYKNILATKLDKILTSSHPSREVIERLQAQKKEAEECLRQIVLTEKQSEKGISHLSKALDAISETYRYVLLAQNESAQDINFSLDCIISLQLEEVHEYLVDAAQLLDISSFEHVTAQNLLSMGSEVEVCMRTAILQKDMRDYEIRQCTARIDALDQDIWEQVVKA